MNSFARTAGALAIMLACAPAVAWEPTKPIEIVVAAGAGGASDQMARMMQAAIQKNKLMSQPMIVTLKGAASGGEALIDRSAPRPANGWTMRRLPSRLKERLSGSERALRHVRADTEARP